LAGKALTRPNGRVVDTAAAVLAAFSEDGNGNEATAEDDIEDKPEEGEEGDASEEESEDDGECGVDDCSP